MNNRTDSQLNLSFSHADLVLTTSAPSGVNPFSARSAAEKDGFFDSTPDYLSWRILLQVCDVQLEEYELATNGDHELWEGRILETLQRINEKAQKFNPQSFPSDIKPATAGSAVLNASGVNWCDAMTRRLSVMFLNVKSVDTSRIEIQAAAPESISNTAALYNLPVLLGADNPIIQQSERTGSDR